MPKTRTDKTETLLDEIKDEIDRLHEIKNKKKRDAAARDLRNYIELHHNLSSS